MHLCRELGSLELLLQVSNRILTQHESKSVETLPGLLERVGQTTHLPVHLTEVQLLRHLPLHRGQSLGSLLSGHVRLVEQYPGDGLVDVVLTEVEESLLERVDRVSSLGREVLGVDHHRDRQSVQDGRGSVPATSLVYRQLYLEAGTLKHVLAADELTLNLQLQAGAVRRVGVNSSQAARSGSVVGIQRGRVREDGPLLAQLTDHLLLRYPHSPPVQHDLLRAGVDEGNDVSELDVSEGEEAGLGVQVPLQAGDGVHQVVSDLVLPDLLLLLALQLLEVGIVLDRVLDDLRLCVLDALDHSDQRITSHGGERASDAGVVRAGRAPAAQGQDVAHLQDGRMAGGLDEHCSVLVVRGVRGHQSDLYPLQRLDLGSPLELHVQSRVSRHLGGVNSGPQSSVAADGSVRRDAGHEPLGSGAQLLVDGSLRQHDVHPEVNRSGQHCLQLCKAGGIRDHGVEVQHQTVPEHQVRRLALRRVVHLHQHADAGGRRDLVVHAGVLALVHRSLRQRVHLGGVEDLPGLGGLSSSVRVQQRLGQPQLDQVSQHGLSPSGVHRQVQVVLQLRQHLLLLLGVGVERSVAAALLVHRLLLTAQHLITVVVVHHLLHVAGVRAGRGLLAQQVLVLEDPIGLCLGSSQAGEPLLLHLRERSGVHPEVLQVVARDQATNQPSLRVVHRGQQSVQRGEVHRPQLVVGGEHLSLALSLQRLMHCQQGAVGPPHVVQHVQQATQAGVVLWIHPHSRAERVRLYHAPDLVLHRLLQARPPRSLQHRVVSRGDSGGLQQSLPRLLLRAHGSRGGGLHQAAEAEHQLSDRAGRLSLERAVGPSEPAVRRAVAVSRMGEVELDPRRGGVDQAASADPLPRLLQPTQVQEAVPASQVEGMERTHHGPGERDACSVLQQDLRLRDVRAV